MSSEGQFTAFTRIIVQYFIITTCTGAVLFVFLHETMDMSCVGNAVNTGTGDKAKTCHQPISNLLIVMTLTYIKHTVITSGTPVLVIHLNVNLLHSWCHLIIIL